MIRNTQIRIDRKLDVAVDGIKYLLDALDVIRREQ